MLSIDQQKLKPADSIAGERWIGPAPWVETALPGPLARAIIARDQAVSAPAYARRYPLVVDRAVGSVVADVDGNRFLDLAAGVAVCVTGHCHPKVAAAVEAQTRRLLHIGSNDFHYLPMVELMEKLARLAPGKGPKRVLLTNSGTETVEAAFLLARYHTGRKWVISFHGAFHGRTMGALSLTCSDTGFSSRVEPLVPMVAHVPYGDLDAIEHQLFAYKMQPDEVAAIFVEPIQGRGGYIVPDSSFMTRLRSLCDKHGILLVVDEIQTGMGRTGKWFAVQHFGVVPDMLLVADGLASGMPLGALIAGTEISRWPAGTLTGTCSGNPASCAAALASIELIETGFLTNANTCGDWLFTKLTELAARFKCLTNVRGIGLLAAIDVVNARSGKSDPRLRERIVQEAFQRGLILLRGEGASIRFCPPLCINRTQLEVGLQLFGEAVATVM
jgi:4-aminobutyrate aminotransferase